MADVSEKVPIKDAAIAISQGKRHLLVRDYNLAVIVLAQACELLVQEHGETGDEMGELYLLYGRALLGLAREEAGVLGGGVPGSEEVNQDEIEEEEDEEESEEGSIAESNNTESRVEKSSSSCTLNGKESDDQESIPKNGNEDPKDTKDEEKLEEKIDEEKVAKSNKTSNDNKNEEKVDKKKQKTDTQIDAQGGVPSCSRYSNLHNNEASSSKNQRKEDEETDAEEEEDEEKEEKENEEDDVNNLQVGVSHES